MEPTTLDQPHPIIHQDNNNNNSHRLSLPSSFFVEALYPFNGEDTASLSFQKGDIIEVLTQLPSGWWDGVMWRQRERGWFPSNYTRRLTDEEADLTRAQLETFKQTSDSTINKIHHPTDMKANHSSRRSVISIHNNNNNNQWDDQQELNHPPISSFESTNPTQSLAPSTKTQNSHHRLPTSTPNQSNSWAAWLPKVTDDGQIYYHNNLTGEIASEMPLADYDLEIESHPTTTTTHESNQPRPISEFHLEDPLKFLQDNGFSKETLIQRGLLSSSPFSSITLFATNQTPACSNISPSSASAQTSTNLDSPSITQSQSNSNHNSELRLSLGLNPPQSSPSDPINPQRHSNPPSDPITSELISDPPHHPLNLNRSSASSSNALTTASSSSGIGSTSKNIFQFSQQLKDKLKPVMEVPATLTFSQMTAEITEAVSLLAKLTEPNPEDCGPDFSTSTSSSTATATTTTTASSSSSQNINKDLKTCSQHTRDELSRASTNLVDKIRFLLQASCQLDTAVLSMLNDSSLAVNFSSLSIAQGRSSSIPPISPYVSSRDSTFSSNSSFQSLITNAHLNFPGLKHVSRKIASTLSKLTLSTRALWGLLSIQSGDPFQINDKNSFTSLDLQEFNCRQNAQNRFALEQKLRSECRMGVSDLSSSIDAFFQHFEGILIEQSGSSTLGSRASSTAHFPRHGLGHFVMPVESIFLPGGARGGNWKASGYDLSHPFQCFSENSRPPTGTLSPLSKRSFSQPSVRLDSEYLTQRFQPLVRRTRELAESIISLLAVDAEEILLTSEPTEMNCIERVGPETADLVLTQVSSLIETSSHLLSTAENLDLCTSLEVDFDQFMWFDLSHDSHPTLKGLAADTIGNVDSLGPISAQLQFARRLVNGYQRSKQAVYDLSADLVYATQGMLTAGAAFWAPQVASPAQPLSASPLFTLHQLSTSSPTPARLVKTARRLILALESLGVAVGALVQEASTQAGQDVKLSGINQFVKNGILQSTTTTPFSETFPPNAIPRRLKSNSSASASISLFRNPPPSPRHQLQSRGIEEEQAELDTSASHAHARENSLDGNSIVTRNREPSAVVHETDGPESASAKSPTRSKNLAKFFGDEAATTVIPALKPVSSKPAFLLPDYGPDDISFNVDNQIRGGTLRGLVIKLTSHEGPDVPFLRVFLMTYRTFTTSHDFLDLLIERYHQQPPPNLLAEELQLWTDQKQKVIKIRVINVIRSWIESHLSDEDADSIIQRVLDFSAHDMGDTNLAKQVALTCERRQSRVALSKMTPMQPPGNPPPSIPPRNLRKIKFLDIDPLELARQLSLVESKLFCQIQANECLGKAWPKEFAKEGTPNIKAMIDMSNALTRWVAETILLQVEQKKRASTIKHFILVADVRRHDLPESLNNFSTLMQIIAGLNSTPIYRLRRTWETIPQKTLTLFSQLGAVMSPTKNYAAYRDTIRNMAPPCVPFVGVYLTDWTFIGDGNPDQLREKPHQINFNKRQKAAELIVQIQSYQSLPYQLSPMPAIVKFLEEALENPRDEKELYDLSLELEPRERDDEKIARLLAESGFL